MNYELFVIISCIIYIAAWIFTKLENAMNRDPLYEYKINYEFVAACIALTYIILWFIQK